MRNTVAAMFGAAVAFGAGPAFAQATFGPQGTAAFSADRLFGFYASSEQVEVEGFDEEEIDYTTFGFAWQGPIHPTPHTVPRLAFDYFVIDSLSIGGSIAYWSYEADPPGDGPEGEGSAFLFAPRVGYVWMFNDVIGFWLRGGLTYHSAEADFGPGEADEHTFNFTLDPVFVITPTQHFGFNFGPLVELTITGEREVDGPGPVGTVDADLRYTTFGITAGIFGWL